MTRDELKDILPHREPMLLVDEAQLGEDGVATAYYHVTGDERFLKGHFPGNPVVPGVVLCEIMAQACAVILADELKGKTPYYTSIDKVRFKGMVKPGDTIVTTARLDKKRVPFYFTSAEAHVNGKLCAKAQMSFAALEGQEG